MQRPIGAATRGIFSFIGFAALTVSIAYCQATGAVQGTAESDSSQPLQGASVVLTTNDPKVGTLTATTDGAGAFSFANLKPGNYSLCLRETSHLDPCAWSTGTGTKVIVKPNQTENVVVTGTAAATLQVRVDDPQKISDPRSGVGAPMVAVILPGGGLAPMSLVSVEDDGRTYQLAVPPGAHKLFIRSDTYKIANGSGQDLDLAPTADGKIRVSPVDAPVSITSGKSYVTVTITGKR